MSCRFEELNEKDYSTFRETMSFHFVFILCTHSFFLTGKVYYVRYKERILKMFYTIFYGYFI